MKTRTQGIRITPRGVNDTDEGYFLCVRTANGDLKTNYLLRKLKEKDKEGLPINDILVPQSLIAEILAAYVKKSRQLKARIREILGLKEKIAELEAECEACETKEAERYEEVAALRAGNVDLQEKLNALQAKYDLLEKQNAKNVEILDELGRVARERAKIPFEGETFIEGDFSDIEDEQ